MASSFPRLRVEENWRRRVYGEDHGENAPPTCRDEKIEERSPTPPADRRVAVVQAEGGVGRGTGVLALAEKGRMLVEGRRASRDRMGSTWLAGVPKALAAR